MPIGINLTLELVLFFCSVIVSLSTLLLVRSLSNDIKECKFLLLKRNEKHNRDIAPRNEYDTDFDLAKRLAVLQQSRFSPMGMGKLRKVNDEE